MLRYLRLYLISLRMSLLQSLTYRWDFVLQGMMQLLWVVLGALPLLVAFTARAGATGTALSQARIGGWDLPAAVVVFGVFTLLRAVLEGAINPSLATVVEQLRSGTLDFLLIKPADAQFLVSTARFEPWHVFDAVGALAFIFYGLSRHAQAGGGWPGPLGLLLAACVFLCGVLILYAIWILVICLAFYVVKLDNLSYLFISLFDFARWPRTVFSGALRVVFTYVIPLLVMTSYPADALLGSLGPPQAAWALGAALGLSAAARWAFSLSIRRYTSASS